MTIRGTTLGEVAGVGWPPHRISLRLPARLLRLPPKGGVIPEVRTGDVVHTLDREHGLHLATESAKKPCAGLKNHSPLEGGVGKTRAKPAVEPEGGGSPKPVKVRYREKPRRAKSSYFSIFPNTAKGSLVSLSNDPRGGGGAPSVPGRSASQPWRARLFCFGSVHRTRL